jgi:hypothetical protein
MLQPAGASTALGGSSGELPRTYSGSSARVDYQQRLELNTQDSDEDVLFRQEMRYPERGAGNFSSLRRASAGESRASPPVQQLEVSEYLTASKSSSERGRSGHRGHLEDRPSASREEIGGDADPEEPEPASCGREDRDRPLVRVTTLGAVDPGRACWPTGHPCPRGIAPVHLCLLGNRRACHLPGVVRACSSRGGTGTTHLPGATAVPCRGSLSLKRATGQVSRPTDNGTRIGCNAMNAIANQVIRYLGRSERAGLAVL